jgi:acetylornithine deacetylase/succinyl-diaminopimelate desuccinylase-like protein
LPDLQLNDSRIKLCGNTGRIQLTAYEFAAQNRERYLKELTDFLKMKSISAIAEYKDEVNRTAGWVMEHLINIGMTRAKLFKTPGHPIVYAEWIGAPDAPTVLIYGHYDVQPPYNDMEKKIPAWKTEPFQPAIVDGNLYARGAADDKGQIFVHIKAVESLLKTNGGKLPVNVKFLIEGEEEVSNENISKFVPDNAALLKADVCVISDSHMLAVDRPTILYALRGISYLQVDLQIAKSDLHSGAYGGVVRNAAQTMAEILAALHNPDGSVNVPGFYDKVVALSPEEREAVNKVPWTDDELRHEAGTLLEQGEQGYTRRERVGLRPTLEINGMSSGFTGEGPKTVLPSTAMAKISCRLVEKQNPEEILGLLEKRITELAPKDAQLTFKRLGAGFPFKTEISDPAIKAAEKAYERGFGHKPVFLPEGGSIPVVTSLKNAIGFPVILMGFGLPDDNLHAPDEKFNLDCFYRGIDTSIALMETLAEKK